MAWTRPPSTRRHANGRASEPRSAAEALAKTVGYDMGTRSLIAEHASFLRNAAALLNAWSLVPRGPGQHIAHALMARVLQLARALHVLIEKGYAAEAAPLARAMASASVSLMYIADRDHDGRARAYILHGLNERRDRLPTLVAAGSLAPERAQEFREKLDRKIARLEAAAADGLISIRAGTSQRTWHGLPNDAALFAQMQVTDWYVKYYRPFSDEIHASLDGLQDEIEDSARGYGLSGPHFEDPRWAIEASGEFVSQSLAQN